MVDNWQKRHKKPSSLYVSGRTGPSDPEGLQFGGKDGGYTIHVAGSEIDVEMVNLYELDPDTLKSEGKEEETKRQIFNAPGFQAKITDTKGVLILMNMGLWMHPGYSVYKDWLHKAVQFGKQFHKPSSSHYFMWVASITQHFGGPQGSYEDAPPGKRSEQRERVKSVLKEDTRCQKAIATRHRERSSANRGRTIWRSSWMNYLTIDTISMLVERTARIG